MTLKSRNFEIAFFLLSIINVVIKTMYGIGYLDYALFAMLFMFKCMKALDNESYLLYSLFVPNKYLQLFSILLFLLFTGKLIVRKSNKRNLVFLSYILTIGVMNCVVYHGTIIAVLFQVCVFYCILRLIEDFNKCLSTQSVCSVFDKMFSLQIITIILQYLITKNTMDALTGTMISAHYLGCFLMVYIFLLYKADYKRKKLELLIKTIISIVALYCLDAKHVVAVFAFAFFLNWFMSKLYIKNKLTVIMMSMTVAIVAIVFLINSGFLNGVWGNIPSVMTYALNPDYNKKYQFYYNTFSGMNIINALLGYGVGNFGSQICLTLAKGIIFSWNPDLSGFHYAITPYIHAINGIMTQWYSETGIVISSMVLGYPLVSYIALVAELGILGLFMFMRILDRSFKSENVTFIIAFLILMHFDTYFEIPCVFILILIAENISKRKPIRRPNIVSMEGK